MPQGSATIKGFVGVNLSKDPSELEDNELLVARNLWCPKPGVPELRGQSKLLTQGNVNGGVGGDQGSTNLMQFTDRAGKVRTLMFFRDISGPGNIILLAEDLTGVDPAGALISVILRENQRPIWFAYNNQLYVMCGRADTVAGSPRGGGLVFSSAEGGTVTPADLSANWTEHPSFTTGWIYRNTGVFSGAVGEESTLRFSEPADLNTLVSLAKGVFIQRGDGDRVVGGVEVTVEGGATYFEPYSIVFKKRSTWMLQGNPPTGATLGSLVLNPLITGEGLVDWNALCKTPYGPAWCSGKNVWLARPGQKPVRIGDPLREFLKLLPQETPTEWNMVFFDGWLRLSVPRPDKYNSLTPSEQWWCDLRDADEEGWRPRWWGPQDLPTATMLVDQTDASVSRLVGVTGLSGAAYIVEFDAKTPGNRDAHHNFTGEGSFPNLDSIEVRTKVFDFGDAVIDKILDAVELVLKSDLAANLTVTLVRDGGSASDTFEANPGDSAVAVTGGPTFTSYFTATTTLNTLGAPGDINFSGAPTTPGTDAIIRIDVGSTSSGLVTCDVTINGAFNSTVTVALGDELAVPSVAGVKFGFQVPPPDGAGYTTRATYTAAAGGGGVLIPGSTLVQNNFQVVFGYPVTRALAKTWQLIVKSSFAGGQAPSLQIRSLGLRVRPIERRSN